MEWPLLKPVLDYLLMKGGPCLRVRAKDRYLNRKGEQSYRNFKEPSEVLKEMDYIVNHVYCKTA